MAKTITCGQALVQLLERYGVDTVFGIPGVHTLELYRGLAQSGIRHVVVRHEQGAGFMADGYARVSGRPGVCFLITGPGVTNAATPIGQAYSDSMPMLVISSVNRTRSLGKGWGQLHEITDQQAVTAPLTAFSATALSPEDLPDLVSRAFSAFESGRPRPVHLEIPIDVLAAPTEDSWPMRPPAPRPAPTAEAAAKAAELLAGAKRPMIVAGGGAVGAGRPLRSIAERLGAAVVTTQAGKGVIPDSHPLSLISSLSDPAVQDMVGAADVVLAIGTELAETDFWRERLPIQGRMIRVDIDPAKLCDSYAATVAMLSDAALAAQAIADALPAGAATSADSVQAEVSRLRTQIRDGFAPKQQGHLRVLDALRRALPADGVLMTDMTQIAYTGGMVFPVEQPRTWFHPMGYGTLGYALPAAIGAKLAAPERPVVALAGDGGFMFTVQELSVAVELGLPIVVLLWNNDAFGQIKDDMIEKQIPPIGVTPKNPDFQALARAFGCHTVCVDDLDQMEAEITAGFARPGPSVIEVREERFTGA